MFRKYSVTERFTTEFRVEAFSDKVRSGGGYRRRMGGHL